MRGAGGESEPETRGALTGPAPQNTPTAAMGAMTERAWIFAGVLVATCCALPARAIAQTNDLWASGASVPTLILLAALALLPFVFMITTSFVKISVVLSILRNALGTGQVPSGAIVAALAALLSLYVMAPVGQQMIDAASPAVADVDADEPFQKASAASWIEAVRLGVEPLRDFLTRNAGKKERSVFTDLARRSRDAADRDAVGDTDLLVVLPAFLITELAEAFQIGFLVFIPFLIIDMVIANVLLALGMHMLSPTTISLPFKLLLFVIVDGWMLLTQALVIGYQ